MKQTQASIQTLHLSQQTCLRSALPSTGNYTKVHLKISALLQQQCILNLVWSQLDCTTMMI